MKRLLLFGASGSIGGSTLTILRDHPEDFGLAGLSVHRNTASLAAWIEEFAPGRVAISDPEARSSWAEQHPEHATRLLPADASPTALLAEPADIVLNGIMGVAGLAESLVCGGEFLREHAAKSRARILPVDSEHSALFQLLEGRARDEIRRVWLTASGGPFRALPAPELEAVTPDQALLHPTWDMGPKITVDSATLVNKGLEVIEAALLFDLSATMIDVLVHPSSTVHALVELADSSVLGQLAKPDMKQPILYALAHPARPRADYGHLDFSTPLRLDFEPVDHERFPAIRLARQALDLGGCAALAFNAADEVAVAAFLAGRLGFTGIVKVLRAVVERGGWEPARGFADLVEADARARRLAASEIENMATRPQAPPRHY